MPWRSSALVTPKSSQMTISLSKTESCKTVQQHFVMSYSVIGLFTNGHKHCVNIYIHVWQYPIVSHLHWSCYIHHDEVLCKTSLPRQYIKKKLLILSTLCAWHIFLPRVFKINTSTDHPALPCHLVATVSWTMARSTPQSCQDSTSLRARPVYQSPPLSTARTSSGKRTLTGRKGCPRRTLPRRCWPGSRASRRRPPSRPRPQSHAR